MVPGDSFWHGQSSPEAAQRLSYLVAKALYPHKILLLSALMRLLALLEWLLLLRLGRGLFVVLGAHVAVAFIVAAGALHSRLLEENILVRLDLDLLVL